MNKFIKELSSSKSAPGGGAASAMYAVLGTALSSMVCALTKDYANIKQYHVKILKLQKIASNLITEDETAYLTLSKAFKDKYGIQEALIPAIEAPLNIMKASSKGLELTKKLIGKTNKYAISDLGCAAMGFMAAIKSAKLSIDINLKYLKKDTNNYRKKVEEIINKYIPLAEEIYARVENEILK